MSVLSHYLLDLPWVFSIMLGFIISAVSPAVVIPLIMYLESQGYGASKGIPTLLIAATSLDDILAIAGFTMCFSVAFSTDNLIWTIIKGPLEPLVGIAFGCVVGVLFWQFPTPRIRRANLVYYNVLLLSLGCSTLIFLSQKYSIPGAGPIGSIALAFVASIRWRQTETHFKAIQDTTTVIWQIIEPFLYGLIGAEVSVKHLENSAAFGVLSIFLALSVRFICTLFISYGAGFTWKERFFICCAWLAKAAIQAAIGAQALDYARRHHSGNEDLLDYATTVLNVSVLSIVLTAPVGASLISLLGPVLLDRDRIPTDEHLDDEGDDRGCKIVEDSAENLIQPQLSEDANLKRNSV